MERVKFKCGWATVSLLASQLLLLQPPPASYLSSQGTSAQCSIQDLPVSTEPGTYSLRSPGQLF